MGERFPPHEAAWTERTLPVLVAVLARIVPDPALAFDLATEVAATALHALEGDEDGPAVASAIALTKGVLGEAARRGQVPCRERLRNASARPHALSPSHLAEIAGLRRKPLDLGAEEIAEVEALECSAPAPAQLARVALSRLVTRPAEVRDER